MLLEVCEPAKVQTKGFSHRVMALHHHHHMMGKTHAGSKDGSPREEVMQGQTGSNYIIFAGKINYNNKELLKLYIDGEEIIKVASTRFIRWISIDEKLTWKDHITIVLFATRLQLTTYLGIIRKICALVHYSNLGQSQFALVRHNIINLKMHLSISKPFLNQSQCHLTHQSTHIPNAL